MQKTRFIVAMFDGNEEEDDMHQMQLFVITSHLIVIRAPSTQVFNEVDLYYAIWLSIATGLLCII